MTDHQKLLCALLGEPDARSDDGSAGPRLTTLRVMSALGALRAELLPAAR